MSLTAMGGFWLAYNQHWETEPLPKRVKWTSINWQQSLLIDPLSSSASNLRAKQNTQHRMRYHSWGNMEQGTGQFIKNTSPIREVWVSGCWIPYHFLAPLPLIRPWIDYCLCSPLTHHWLWQGLYFPLLQLEDKILSVSKHYTGNPAA